MRKIFALALGALACAAATSANAQQQQLPAAATQTSGIKRTPLQKFDVPGANYETVIGLAEVSPNVMIGKHTHAGVESGYVLEGELILMVSGQPEKTLKPGDSYQIPPGAAHDAKGGAQGGKIIATYVVEKGKPLATPAQ